jgi:hypothetical protein
VLLCVLAIDSNGWWINCAVGGMLMWHDPHGRRCYNRSSCGTRYFLYTVSGPCCVNLNFVEGRNLYAWFEYTDRLCGLVVRVLGDRSGGPASIPGTTRKKVVGLERGPLSLVSTAEELLGRKRSGSCLENREYCRRDPSCWPHGTFYPQKSSITSPTSGGRSVGIVWSWTQTMEFSFFLV